MSKGIRIVVVCEDQEQQGLLRRYMETCGIDISRDVDFKPIPSRLVGVPSKDSGTKRVREEFVKELRACRAVQARRKVLLVTMIDADKPEWNLESRRKQLETALDDERPLTPNDPYVRFVPKRNVETWIRAALGYVVNEKEDYKKTQPSKAEIRTAARQIHGWARNRPDPGPTCVDSLRQSLADWRRIG